MTEIAIAVPVASPVGPASIPPGGKLTTPTVRTGIEVVSTTVQNCVAMVVIAWGLGIGKLDPTISVGALLAIVGVDVIGRKTGKSTFHAAPAILAVAYFVGWQCTQAAWAGL